MPPSRHWCPWRWWSLWNLNDFCGFPAGLYNGVGHSVTHICGAKGDFSWYLSHLTELVFLTRMPFCRLRTTIRTSETLRNQNGSFWGTGVVWISCFLPTGFKNSKSFIELVKNRMASACEIDRALASDPSQSRQSTGFFSEGRMSK